MHDALSEARRLQETAAAAGFDWPEVSGALAKLREEVDELDGAVAKGNVEEAERELGDVLFSVVNVSRFISADATRALAGANARFWSRFGRLRQIVQDRGKRLEDCTLDELDAVWDALKADGNQSGGAHAL